jgi:hypothetical protein
MRLESQLDDDVTPQEKLFAPINLTKYLVDQ